MNIPLSRRTALKAAATIPFLSLSCGGSDEPPPTEDDSLIVFLIIDTVRWDALGCYGREGARTPHIDALAEEGVRFEQAISSSGWTLPSVASMLTGTWPALHKATGKATGRAAQLTPITDDLPTAAEVFDQNGYATLGVVNAAFLHPLLGINRGFDRFDHRAAYNDKIRRADETVEVALQAIGEQGGSGMFALLHVFDPHLDYDPLDEFREPFAGGRTEPKRLTMQMCRVMGAAAGGTPEDEDLRYMRGLYQAEIAAVDAAVGKLVDGLKKLGVWDRTTLVLTSDHGEEFWDHGGFEHGHTLYDELIHVPLAIRLRPDRPRTTAVVKNHVRTIDIMPTLFELSGIEQPKSFEGSSLLPLIDGATTDVPRPAFSQSTLYGNDKISWRTNRFHFIFDQKRNSTRPIELYDWTVDPYERNDLTEKMPEQVTRMKNRLSVFYGDLKRRAKSISTPKFEDMTPAAQQAREQLESLGYTDGARDG